MVHSYNEIDYYSRELSVDKNKFEFVPLGIVDVKNGTVSSENGDYVLCVGNSNRDFQFIESSLLGMPYDVRVYSDEYPKHVNCNIKCESSIPAKDYLNLLARCKCMVVPLKDTGISSGQLVILQSYALGKPVIVTLTEGCREYIITPGAIPISKTKDDLINAIASLEDKEWYQVCCDSSREIFENNFSLTNTGKKIGSIFADIIG